jgi:VanZ family protein
MTRTMTWAMRTVLLGVSLFVVAATLSGPKSALGSLALTPSDKLTHFLAFYLIALLAAASLPSRRLWLTAACVVILGLALEFLQGFVGREPSINDALFNIAGITMALVPFAAARLAQGRPHAQQPRTSRALDGADQSPSKR